jgi:Family of unknown function (DUF6263)
VGATSRLLLSVGLVLGSVAFANAQTKLKYKFEQGQKIPYGIKQTLNMSMEIGGQAVVIKMNLTMDQNWEIKKVAADGTADLAQRVTRLQISMDTPQGKIEFDSKDGKEPEDELGKKLATVFRALVDADIGMAVTPLGKIKDIRIPEKILAAFKNDPVLAQVGEMFTEAGMRRMMAQSMIVFPEKGLNKNDTWKNDPVEINNAGVEAKIQVTDTFDGVDKVDGREIAKFTRKLEMEFKPNAQATIKIKSQDIKAAILFDVAGGYISSTDMKQKMTMEVSQNDMTITINIDQTLGMKRAK